MKKIGIVFSHAPYGIGLGKYGVNFCLSMACYNSKIGVFFIGDGVFQILRYQQPDVILHKNYSLSFKMFSIFNIQKLYVCYDSLLSRGLNQDTQFLLKVNICKLRNIRKKMENFDFILNF
ncbi:sulfurtransferase complex subunit TusC [Buchnera aphidicola]|uniref:sulfurtransferase complex subunit TusC n=1 Tax=Buchnera aphidicola TaxID=9 RepID=UPI0031B895BD